jgi:hypothetical protein
MAFCELGRASTYPSEPRCSERKGRQRARSGKYCERDAHYATRLSVTLPAAARDAAKERGGSAHAQVTATRLSVTLPAAARDAHAPINQHSSA